MGTVYLMLADKPDKYNSDKFESDNPSQFSNNKKLYNLSGLSWMVKQRNEFIIIVIVTVMGYHLLRAYHCAKCLPCVFSLKLKIRR